MNRKHTIEEYVEIIKKLKKSRPSIKFSSDFIIGYPGETEDDFNKTISLMEEFKFINSYSFTFSPRPGTPAANLNQINIEEAKKRLIFFQKISEKIKKEYREKLLYKETEVLFENKTKNQNEFFGRDKYQNSVIVKCKSNLVGKIINVKINDFNVNTLFGEISFNEKNSVAA